MKLGLAIIYIKDEEKKDESDVYTPLISLLSLSLNARERYFYLATTSSHLLFYKGLYK